MLSLYIHIPFCHHKCSYCSFHVIPLDGLKESEHTSTHSPLISNYLDALHRQIDTFSQQLQQQSIQTIYFGGGTPSIIWAKELIKIIDHIMNVRDTEHLAELSIEINPDPIEDMLWLMTTISSHYKQLPRVRFSIGIQSFDNEVLKESGRQYNFQACVNFLRRLVPLKQDNNVFNFDFIAFGKFNTTRKGDRQLRNPSVLDFFQTFVESGFADSFSLYTLELFEWSERYHQQINHYSHAKEWYGLKKYGSDDDVYEEFQLLKEILIHGWYQRYEISNYSHAGKNSIHNRIYRSMWQWLWLGTGATSYLTSHTSPSFPLPASQDISFQINPLQGQRDDHKIIANGKVGIGKEPSLKGEGGAAGWGTHFTTTSSLKEFLAGNYIDDKKTEYLTEHDYLKEQLLMWLRIQEGIMITHELEQILTSDREAKIILYTEQWLCIREDSRLKLTDSGMDVYNSIVTEIMK